MKYLPLNNSLFKKNRSGFTAMMQPNSMAIFLSNDKIPLSNDQFYPFRQNPNLFYLTGIDQNKTALLIYPDCPDSNLRETLFIPDEDKNTALWEGYTFTKEKAKELSGIENVVWKSSFDKYIQNAMSFVDYVYLDTNESFGNFYDEHNSSNLRFAHKLMHKYPLHNYHRANPLISNLRMIKSEEEIKAIKTAIDITSKAFYRILKFVRPGIAEYEVEAALMYEYLSNRATGHSFNPIIASGSNACILHYTTNNSICKSGELLLIDTGAEYANYSSDISRTIPVNGRFLKRQKEVYNSVLKVFKEAKSMLLPGITLNSYHKEICKLMESELIKLKLISKEEVKKQNPDNPLYKKYFPHGISHFIGLDVHDSGNKFEPLKPGMILSCEPGIYIPEENMGIRIENDIQIAEKQPIDLTENIPCEAEEIEQLMNT